MSDADNNDTDKPRGKELHKLKTRPLDRNMAMARVGVVAGSQVIGHELFNLFRSGKGRAESDSRFYAKQAQYLADELGKLKGSVMKVGQMLSLYGQYFMPPEAVSVLASLQDDTPPVAWSAVRPVIEEALGPRRMSELEIDPVSLASASLGQVHRARRKSDGRELVLKVQYPGVANAIDSDVRTMTRIVSMSKLMPKGISLEPIMEEVREMLHQEVDYGREQRMTQTFYDGLKDDPRYVVPEVIGDYCADAVLCLSYEDAVHVKSAEVQNLPQERRNRIAENALDLFFQEFFEWGVVQTDPHFGNYKIRLDPKGENDQMLLMDFGATRRFSKPFLDHYYNIVAGAFHDDHAQLLDGAEGIGLMRTQFSDDVRQSFIDVCRLIIEPFVDPAEHAGRVPEAWLTEAGAYRWGDTDLPKRVSAAVAKAAMSRYFRVPPREIVFLHRRLVGVFVLVAVLGGELKSHELLGRHVASGVAVNE